MRTANCCVRVFVWLNTFPNGKSRLLRKWSIFHTGETQLRYQTNFEYVVHFHFLCLGHCSNRLFWYLPKSAMCGISGPLINIWNLHCATVLKSLRLADFLGVLVWCRFSIYESSRKVTPACISCKFHVAFGVFLCAVTFLSIDAAEKIFAF